MIGVAPNDVQLLGRTSLWALVPIQGAPATMRGAYFLRAIGRMKPGVSVQAAVADLGALADTLAREFPKTNTGRSVTLAALASCGQSWEGPPRVFGFIVAGVRAWP